MLVAESEGFEPPIRCRIPDFESGAFDHSANSPRTADYTDFAVSPGRRSRCRHAARNENGGRSPRRMQPRAATRDAALLLRRCRARPCAAGAFAAGAAAAARRRPHLRRDDLALRLLLGDVARRDAVLGLRLLRPSPLPRRRRPSPSSPRRRPSALSSIGGGGGSFATAMPKVATTSPAAISARSVVIVAPPRARRVMRRSRAALACARDRRSGATNFSRRLAGDDVVVPVLVVILGPGLVDVAVAHRVDTRPACRSCRGRCARTRARSRGSAAIMWTTLAICIVCARLVEVRESEDQAGDDQRRRAQRRASTRTRASRRR